MLQNMIPRNLSKSDIPIPLDRPQNEPIYSNEVYQNQLPNNSYIQSQMPYYNDSLNSYLNPPNKIYEKNDGIVNKIMEHKWCISKAIFYSLLFYCLTSPSIIEVTSYYVPEFMSKRTAHTFIFGLFYLLLNCRS